MPKLRHSASFSPRIRTKSNISRALLGARRAGWAVSQWMKRAREEGVEGLRHKPPPGATPRLSEKERTELAELLTHDAQAYGFRGKVWTCERVAELINREFGVRYHPAHVSRLVRALGLSLQKPARRANQRDEEAIDHWKENRWPELKKGL